MNPALLIFTQIAMVGCGFMVYFLYALHRELRQSRRSPKVEIRPLATRTARLRIIRIYAMDEGRDKPRRISSVSGR